MSVWRLPEYPGTLLIRVSYDLLALIGSLAPGSPCPPTLSACPANGPVSRPPNRRRVAVSLGTPVAEKSAALADATTDRGAGEQRPFTRRSPAASGGHIGTITTSAADDRYAGISIRIVQQTLEPAPVGASLTGKEPTMADNVELVMRFHPVGGEDVSLLSNDFTDEAQALATIAQALDERHALVLTRARYNREAAESGMVINLANVVSVRVSNKDSDTTGQYL